MFRLSLGQKALATSPSPMPDTESLFAEDGRLDEECRMAIEDLIAVASVGAFQIG